MWLVFLLNTQCVLYSRFKCLFFAHQGRMYSYDMQIIVKYINKRNKKMQRNSCFTSKAIFKHLCTMMYKLLFLNWTLRPQSRNSMVLSPLKFWSPGDFWVLLARPHDKSNQSDTTTAAYWLADLLAEDFCKWDEAD